MQKPALYISFYLKKNRIEYYDRMSEVRAKNNYEQWDRSRNMSKGTRFDIVLRQMGFGVFGI